VGFDVLVQSGKTASGGCSTGQGSPEPVAPRIYLFILFYFYLFSFIYFPFVPSSDHMASFGVSVITNTIRNTVDLFWTSDQPDAETYTNTGQHSM
jgi:hypothetical protein